MILRRHRARRLRHADRILHHFTPRIESLESRHLLAAYAWDATAHTLLAQSGNNEDLTVTKSGDTISIKSSSGTFAQAGPDTATGDGTDTISFTSSQVDASFQLDNFGASSGTENIVFNGPGTITSQTIGAFIGKNNAGATTGSIVVQNGFNLTASTRIWLDTVSSVVINPGSTLTATADAAITLEGNDQATPTSGAFNGVVVNGTLITQGAGDINITGHGGNFSGSDRNRGVFIFGGQIESQGTGAIIIAGTGGDGGTNNNVGVSVENGGHVTSVAGPISITGSGGTGTEDFNIGVAIVNGTIAAAGTAPISITGTGGIGTDDNAGIASSTGTVLSENGDVLIQGTAVDSVGVLNDGALLLNSTNVSTTGAGKLTVNGTSAGVAGVGIELLGTTFQLSGASNAFVADSIDISPAATILATGAVALRQQSGGTSINLGGNDAAGVLGLTNAELGRITAASIVAGDSNSGSLTVSSPITVVPALAIDAPTVHLQADLSADGGLSGAATIINVENTAAQIQDAIDISAPAATINISAGTYLGDVDATARSVTLAPGGAAAAALVTIFGNLTLDSNDTLAMEIHGAAMPGVDYDQFFVTGAATLGGALLSTLSYAPLSGDTITLIDAAVLNGTFVGLPEGTAAVGSLRIHYDVANGNVVLQEPILADVSVSNTVSRATVLAGGMLGYNLTISNSGPEAAQDVHLQDVLPGGTTIASLAQVSGPLLTLSNAGNIINASIATLTAGQSAVIKIVVQVDPDLADNTILASTAQVSTSNTDFNNHNNTSTATTTAKLTNVFTAVNPAKPSQTDLYIGGTNASDAIAVTLSKSGQLIVTIGANFKVTYAINGKIYVFGRGGNDTIAIGASVRLAAVLDGGAGNDTLVGGGGSDVLVGGIGNDTLIGRGGRNLLIGGGGKNKLSAGSAGDILIGGTTAYDDNFTALDQIMAEWTSNRSYADRTANIRGNGSGPRVNGSVFLNSSGPNATVFDNAANDILTGGAGRDWFFAKLSNPNKDVLNGKAAGEIVASM